MRAIARFAIVLFALGCTGSSPGSGDGGGGGGGDGGGGGGGDGGGGGGGDGGGGGGGDGGGGGGGDGGVAMGCSDRAAASVRLMGVGSGFSRPVFVTSPPGSSTMYVVEQGGRIRPLGGGSDLANFSGSVENDFSFGESEWGLLGLAFHPGYSSNNRYFVHYVASGGDSVVIAEGTGGSLDPLVTIPNSSGHHYGGMLAFGSDGQLYASVGDADSGQSRNASDPHGKVLRINPDTGSWTAFARGLRNPWRFSFDRGTGDMYIGEVGDTWEEINQVRSGMSGIDFGWPDCDGASCSGSTTPIHATQNSKAIIGGYVYRGSAIPSLQGAYVYTDYQQGWVRTFRSCGDGSVGDEHELSISVGDIASLGEDSSGELYFVDFLAGTVQKLMPM